jgi:hypothetical protein
MRYILIILGVILFISTSVYADIYKYVDEDGVVCYTDTPFGKKVNRVFRENVDSTPGQPQLVKADYNVIEDYHGIVHEKASEYNMDPSLIKAVIKTESNWNSRAVSRKGAKGLMQLMPTTASDMNVHNPFNPEENIEGGTKYLKYLLERFNGDLTLALAAYNAGPKTVEKFGFVPPITETKQYVNKVLSLYNGKTKNLLTGPTKKGKPESIYKVTLEDGTILFTNSAFFLKNSNRF